MPPSKPLTDRQLGNIEKRLGLKVKLRRRARGVTQSELARQCGVTFQQIQKYEKGTNRVSVSRLIQIARALETPVSEMLDGLL